MKTPWQGRTQHCAPRPFKSILGRCVLFTAFTVMVLLIYMTMGADRRTIPSPGAAMIQSSNPDETSLSPLPSIEFQALSTEPSLSPVVNLPDTRASSNASSQIVESAAPPEVSEVQDTRASRNASFKIVDAAAPPEVVADTRNTSSNSTASAAMCDGRRIFVYKLPAEFNEALARDCRNWPAWPDMCEDISNHGFGTLPEAIVLRPSNSWYRTDQFTLEVIMRERLKAYPCLTTNPEEASMFYIPLYHTLDLIRTLYKPDLAARDRVGKRLASWLRAQAPFQLHHGRRHVLVLGRIYWDYCRSELKQDTWGSDLLMLPELFNVSKLLIERSPWKQDTVGIPYPTSFHPSSESELREWQATVLASKRKHLVSLAGAKRKKSLTGGIRDAVFGQCANSSLCNELVCTRALCVGKPETIIRMGLHSVFCLQPPGDSPTRKGIFDSLQAGCIPVLFNFQQAAQQYLFHLPGNGTNYSVVIPEGDVVLRNYDVVDHLARIPASEVSRMRGNIVKLLPSLLYRNPSLTGEYTSKDAFDVAMDGLFSRFHDDEAKELLLHGSS